MDGLVKFQHFTAAETPAWAQRWPNFTPTELACHGSGALLIDTAFLDRLQCLRELYGRPIVVTSGYRSPAYNARVSTTGIHGPHTTGCAVDVAIRGAEAHRLLRLALASGAFTGIGVKQTGPHAGRFIHLDTLPATGGRPRPWIWSY